VRYRYPPHFSNTRAERNHFPLRECLLPTELPGTINGIKRNRAGGSVEFLKKTSFKNHVLLNLPIQMAKKTGCYDLMN
jgi:hypothetical protein